MNTNIKQIQTSSTPLRSGPSLDFSIETECLFGESIETIELKNNFVFCKCIIDDYKGWIDISDIGTFRKNTHKIITLRSFVYKLPDIKSTIIFDLPYGSQVSVKSILNDWAEIFLKEDLFGFVPLKHIIDIEKTIKDWVFVAEQFINTPYKWGGRNSIGIDCSALIQLSLQAAGILIPRDTKEQEKMKWKEISKISMLERGALVFWKGHIGVMIDKNNLLHANGYSMSVKKEPLKQVINRHTKNNIGEITRMIVYELN